MRNVSFEVTTKRWSKYYSSIEGKNGQEKFNKDFKKYTFTHTWNNSIRIIQKYAGIENGKKILDAGCGWGRLLLGIVDRYSDLKISALDFQADAIEKGKRIIGEKNNNNNIQWVTGDIQNLQFEDNSFDSIYSARVFQHLNSPEKGAEEIFRVLRPGGRFVIFLQNKVCPLNITYYSRLYSPKQVNNWFRSLPVKNLHCTTMDFYPPFLGFGFIRSFSLKIETLLENIPMLNNFGGKVIITGTK